MACSNDPAHYIFPLYGLYTAESVSDLYSIKRCLGSCAHDIWLPSCVRCGSAKGFKVADLRSRDAPIFTGIDLTLNHDLEHGLVFQTIRYPSTDQISDQLRM
jgi:hypothetical protein